MDQGPLSIFLVQFQAVQLASGTLDCLQQIWYNKSVSLLLIDCFMIRLQGFYGRRPFIPQVMTIMTKIICQK